MVGPRPRYIPRMPSCLRIDLTVARREQIPKKVVQKRTYVELSLKILRFGADVRHRQQAIAIIPHRRCLGIHPADEWLVEPATWS